MALLGTVVRRLGMFGDYALTIDRRNGSAGIHIGFEMKDDADRLAFAPQRPASADFPAGKPAGLSVGRKYPW